MFAIWEYKQIDVGDWEFDKLHRELARLTAEGWLVMQPGKRSVAAKAGEEGCRLQVNLVKRKLYQLPSQIANLNNVVLRAG